MVLFGCVTKSSSKRIAVGEKIDIVFLLNMKEGYMAEAV